MIKGLQNWLAPEPQNCSCRTEDTYIPSYIMLVLIDSVTTHNRYIIKT